MPAPLSTFSSKEDGLWRMGTVAKIQVTEIVIRSSLVGTLLKLLHGAPKASYPGRDRTLSMARAKYSLLTVRLDIEGHIAQCISCGDTKGTTQTAPVLEYPLSAGLFDVVSIGLLQLLSIIQGSTKVCV